MRGKNVFRIFAFVLLLVILANVQVVILHASAQPPDLPTNSCADCHRKLIFTSEAQRQFIEIRIRHLESGITCSIVCHEDKLNKTTASTYAMWSISNHALFNVTCEKCHGGNPQAVSKGAAHVGVSKINIARANTPETCGKCHGPELEEFKNSKHYKILESGGEGPAPACITCHQAHSVRVLTSSEIEDFCSNCHNRITGIDPTVPSKAEEALFSVTELEAEISRARSAVLSAKAEGRDVTGPEEDLEAARAILKHVPSVWHRFNLTFFETEVQKGIEDAKLAERLISAPSASPVPTRSPGFELILIISGLLAAYYLKRYKD